MLKSNTLGLLNTSMRHLQRSASEYDRGDVDEAFRLATEIISLLYDDGKNCTSLMTQLGQRDSFPFFTSVGPLNPANILAEYPLAVLASYEYPQFSPTFNNMPAGILESVLPFEKWWNQEVFMGEYQPERTVIKRGDLVRSYRNARGSHKDKTVRSEPLKKIIFEGVGWSLGDSPALSVEKAMIRQISWEVEQSILFPFACIFPFRSELTFTEEIFLISQRPYVAPIISFIGNSDAGWGAQFVLRNWGGVPCNKGRAAVSFGTSLSDTSWIGKEAGTTELSIAAQQSDAIMMAISQAAIDRLKSSAIADRTFYLSLSIEYTDPGREREVTIFSVGNEINKWRDPIWPLVRCNTMPKIGISPTK